MSLFLLTAILTLCLILGASLTNSKKIIDRKVNPALSTWVIILAASSMSFASYLASGNHDIVAGILNASDVLSTLIISCTIIFFGLTRWKLKPFEKYYFMGLILIGVFWFFTRNPFDSNLLIQLLISIGYIPTAHNIIASERNTESFTVWGLIFAASVISLYPSIHAWLQNGNVLAFIYSLRSVVMIGCMLILMSIYHMRPKEVSIR